jgi:hypothetical protein
VNFGICWWNCYSCGSNWAEARVLGGWGRLAVWCGAIQAAFGFTMVYALALALVAYGTGHLPPQALRYTADIAYLTVIVPLVGSGIIITIESWRQFVARPSLGGGLTTAWNTYAQISNTYGAVQGIGGALSELGGIRLGGDNDEDDGAWLMIAAVIVACALAAGVLTAYTLIRRYAGTRMILAT